MTTEIMQGITLRTNVIGNSEWARTHKVAHRRRPHHACSAISDRGRAETFDRLGALADSMVSS